MCHITTWEEDYKGNNTSPSLQSPLANSSSPSCTDMFQRQYKFCMDAGVTGYMYSVSKRVYSSELVKQVSLFGA